jgi:dipeptidyl aminopeptidase/acylaminoacyl peptidase
MYKAVSLATLLLTQILFAQKKALDHTVYDSWQSIGERMISNDGNWIAYTVNPQEGDNELVIQSADASYKKIIPRGFGATITEDSRFLICKIKPFYADTREARIKKKKPDEMPKDSILIVRLGTESTWKFPRVKSFKTPEKSYGWVAYQLEKQVETPVSRSKAPAPDNKKLADSLRRVIDSLQVVIETMPKPDRKKKNRDEDEIMNTARGFSGMPYLDAEGDETGGGTAPAATDLVLRKLEKGEQKIFANVLEYYFSKNGQKLLVEVARNPKDSLSYPFVLLYDTRKGFGDTLSRGGNDFKNFAMTDDGSQVAYLAERDARPKELQKFYRVWYFKDGMDSATLLLDKNSPGMQLGVTVSEFGNLSFSKSGNRLFFGTAPIQPPRDTTLVDFETAKLDVWHYNDDYLQTVQLYRLQRDLQENFLAVYFLDRKSIVQLGSKEIPTVVMTDEGDGPNFFGVTDYGKRIESQWTGNTKKDIYEIHVEDGSRKLVKKDMLGFVSPQYVSPSGRYVLWYEGKARNYFAWNGREIRNITSSIKVPLYNEENDVPNDPAPYGIMGWQEGDSAVYIYDRYDIWKVSLASANAAPVMITPHGRNQKTSYRYNRLDPDEKYLKSGQQVLYRTFDDRTKSNGLGLFKFDQPTAISDPLSAGAYVYSLVQKAKNANTFIYTRESYIESPDLCVNKLGNMEGADSRLKWSLRELKISALNPQQKDYNWGTAELFKWKTFKGHESEGILYKPEDFNPSKKYPVIVYFYEELSNGLNSYIPPSPTPSRLNISFFVSRGYVVFAPDIKYTTGHPAQSAYDYIVSGAKALTKFKWVDAKNMGIQGQSWGGIQVAQLVTLTDMFKAAWAGAPVANMTSAYGGIRWEGGVNREFQYEKGQSRIGATLWEKPQLYIENSPLFHLPAVRTPLVIMSNDADGAVPWYQGIELFTAMRRLGKKAWLLNYNGEAHNLVERRNRKDIQVRQQQFFDWLLKGDKPTRWITEGIPAVKKGRDWGLETVE